MFCDSEREVVAGVTRDGSVSILTNAVFVSFVLFVLFVLCARHGGGTRERPTVREM
jgi:hypothetical protein